MKKILIMAFILLTGTLYAQVTVNGAIDMAIIPFQLILNEGANEIKPIGAPEQEKIILGAGAGRNASGQGPRARLDFRASHESIIGMRARIQARTDGIGIEDYLQAWWQPLPWLRLDAGRFLDDRLRGKINDLDERWNAYTVRMYDADAIFSRFKTHWTGQAGIMLSLNPPVPALENLWLGSMLYGLNPLTSAGTAGIIYDAHPDYINDNADVWKRIQAAVSYTIPEIGIARVQYIGVKPVVEIKQVTDEWVNSSNTYFYSYMFEIFSVTAPRFEAAFAYTGLSGLTIDIGAKACLPFKNWDRGPENIFEKDDEALLDPIYRAYKDGIVWQAPYQVSLGAKYKAEKLELAGRIDTKFLGSMKAHKNEIYFAPEINAHIWPSWDFSFARLIMNFGCELLGATYDKNKELIGKGSPLAMNGGYRLGAGISLQKTIINNCFIKSGLAYKFGTTVNGIQEKPVLSIPIHIEYMF